MSEIARKLRLATEYINERGTVGKGGNNQAEFDATEYVVPGYYPDETHYYIGVDVEPQWIDTASLSVQSELTERGLLCNSFTTEEFTGYGDDETHIEHDYIFHVVPIGWLPDREGPQYD